MNKISNFQYILLLVFIALSSQNYSQNTTNSNYYNWFDNAIGVENTNLFNGVRYEDKYLTKDGNHQYYQSDQFQYGNINYDGQEYFDIKMKYDIYEDVIIVDLLTQTGSNIFQLNPGLIHSFILNKKTFINISQFDFDIEIEKPNRFYEIAYKNADISFLIKHKKDIQRQIENKVTYYHFSNVNSYHLYYNDKFYPLNSKKDFLTIFPEKKKQINKFYSENKKMLKSNKEIFTLQLVKNISG